MDGAFFNLIYLIYGTSFIMLGIAVFIIPRSNILNHLNWLGSFGTLHGLLELVESIRIHASLTSLAFISGLLLVSSFIALFEYGRRIWNETTPNLTITAIPVYSTIALILTSIIFITSSPFTGLEIGMRYIIGAPGSILAGTALLKKIHYSNIDKTLATWMRITAVSFVSYGLLTLFPGQHDSNILTWLPTSTDFHNYTGLPVQLFRALCAVFITWTFIVLIRHNNTLTSNALQQQLFQLNAIDRIGSLCLQSNPDIMLSNVLDEILSIFRCDRAWVLSPCDPDAESWSVPMERTLPQWPGASVRGMEIPMDPYSAEVFRTALGNNGVVTYGPGTGRDIPEPIKIFSIQSQMCIPIFIKNGQPWLLGIHYCARPHIFNAIEERLFLDISHRISDTLSSLLANTELDKSKKSLAEAQFLARIGSWEINLHKQTAMWSDEMYRLLNLNPDNTQPSFESFLDCTHPDDRERLTTTYLQAIKEKSDFELEHRLQTAPDSVKYVLTNCAIHSDSTGSPEKAICSSQDITRQKNIELELKRHRKNLEEIIAERTHDLITARDEAELSNNAKSAFLSRMSHELRTPLNAIIGFSQLLQLENENLTHQQIDRISEIITAGHHLLRLVNEVLDLSRIETGNMEINITDVNVNDVLNSTLALILPEIKSANISLQNNIINQHYQVQADPSRLTQVLLNLLSNAVKYNKANGRITLDQEISNHQLCIRISDTGAGLNIDELSRLFTPFERLDQTNKIDGTGIGLVISRNLIELMAGTIGVTSKKGEGSTFWIKIPLSQSAGL